MGTRRLEGLQGEVGGESPADEVRNGCSERVEAMEKEEERDGTNDDVSLGNLSTLFDVLQDGVVVELSSIA